MSGTYVKEQQIQSFSFSVNSAFGLSFTKGGGHTAMQKMQAYVTKVSSDILQSPTIQGLIGNDWTTVWGPVVYANDPTSVSVHADNTMGAYYSPSQNLFVVAIAGTNLNSFFGWVDEDFMVSKLVPWSSLGVGGSGNISQGTDTGLEILLRRMPDPHSGDGLIKALSTFMTQHHIRNAEIAVAGHSLGGALAPVLALYLHLSSSIEANMSAYPSAGPTPGDQDFASYYKGLIGTGAGKIDYQSRNNSLDVVPLAWQASDLAKIPTLYAKYIKPISGANPQETAMGIVATGLALNALASTCEFLGKQHPCNKYQQIEGPGSKELPGTFDKKVDDEVTKKLGKVGGLLPPKIHWVLPDGLTTYAPYLIDFARFAAQAAAQHTSEYDALLRITAFMNAYRGIVANNKPGAMIAQAPHELAVTAATGIDLRAIRHEDLANAGKRPAKRKTAAKKKTAARKRRSKR